MDRTAQVMKLLMVKGVTTLYKLSLLCAINDAESTIRELLDRLKIKECNRCHTLKAIRTLIDEGLVRNMGTYHHPIFQITQTGRTIADHIFQTAEEIREVQLNVTPVMSTMLQCYAIEVLGGDCRPCEIQNYIKCPDLYSHLRNNVNSGILKTKKRERTQTNIYNLDTRGEEILERVYRIFVKGYAERKKDD